MDLRSQANTKSTGHASSSGNNEWGMRLVERCRLKALLGGLDVTRGGDSIASTARGSRQERGGGRSTTVVGRRPPLPSAVVEASPHPPKLALEGEEKYGGYDRR